ncbi:phage tail assembly protein T [Salmonella enterica subsp. diarizonae serovar 48:i:z]|uniref:Phage tail assembly protein T n=1 Tax=Salmonella enterica subsp. diarizonae serovar 48:i:z TaxID=1192842 RepID=A0A7U5YEM5_SALDZ|nr:phage tail assembly protein T [Salmonella enterica]EAW1261844.1 phage tail assembly protein T [Salmonella enterica subsp. diarizonae]AXC71539.1 phage tail assembly protein T [Salmonella enterica subsp. diarizonae serovar 48:i:z]AXC73005.1 phage tail assembly protein T [Salmonella enterica subsp. diarizonae serovar 48:i:z]EEG1121487.1 phage tail assembly protein T [Salmonella enterica subsp. diarizonae]EKK4208766.1 phage tail assembly protein T [Salmonella enterica]
MQLAREFGRGDWRRMLSEMSATELGEWSAHFRQYSFTNVLLDAEFSTLKSLLAGLMTGNPQDAKDFSLMPDPELEPAFVKNDDDMMFSGEGIFGGIRYGPDS